MCALDRILLLTVALLGTVLNYSNALARKPFIISPFPLSLDNNDLEDDDDYGQRELIRQELEKYYEEGYFKGKSLKILKSQQRPAYNRLVGENPDIYLNTPQLIAKYGYPVEIHNVTTEDGYILQMHRIKHGKNYTSKVIGQQPQQRVVFLQHGMFGTSADWILNSVDKALAYLLADAGYDVWLGNARGNIYSQKHVSLSPNDYKFWKFSWHEMGYFDLKAEIDYVLQETGHEQIYYVGHSMGTTMFFVFMSTRPEYNQKIKFMAALGPAVFLNNTKSSAKFFAKWWGPVEKFIIDEIGHGVLFPKLVTKLINKFAPEFCTPELRSANLCEDFMSLIVGYDPAQANFSMLPVILGHEPSTVSTRTGFHYFQCIRTGEFRMYNNGFHTGSELSLPQKYNLSNVHVPVALFWGENDVLCDPTDVARLAKTLPNVPINFKVNFTKFNHVDFIFAKDVDILVNKPLMLFLDKY